MILLRTTRRGWEETVLCPTCRTKPWSLPAPHQPPDGLGVHGLNDHFLSLSLSLPAHTHPWICPLGSQTHPFFQLGGPPGTSRASTLGFPWHQSWAGGHPGAQHPPLWPLSRLPAESLPHPREKGQLPRQAFIAQPETTGQPLPHSCCPQRQQPKGQNELERNGINYCQICMAQRHHHPPFGGRGDSGGPFRELG